MSEENIWIEADGKRVVFTTKTITGNTINIPELVAVHKAIVAFRGARYLASVNSIAGNNVTITITDTTSGVVVTGASLSGEKVDVVAAGV